MERSKSEDKFHHEGFAAGIAVACSTLVGVWGEEVAAIEIMCGAGLETRAKMKSLGVDKHDLDILKPVFKQIAQKRASRKSRHGQGGDGK